MTPAYEVAALRPVDRPSTLDRAQGALSRFPGKAAFGLIGLGLLAIVIGIAGVRSATVGTGSSQVVKVEAQLPYLMSGGIGGLALVITGCALLVVQSHRAEGARLQAVLREVAAAQAPAVAPAAADVRGLVVAGASSYHLPTCRLVSGRSDLDLLLPAEAVTRRLAPCRVCRPAD